jgi:hypothetical protein
VPIEIGGRHPQFHPIVLLQSQLCRTAPQRVFVERPQGRRQLF